MRILNVTQSYAPFFEFGGPPEKVRALSEGLVRLGHEVTVLTADWGLERRLENLPGEPGAENSPFGKRREVQGVKAIYLPNWLHYHAVSWNPALPRYLRARLGNFDVVHIFGLYDLLGVRTSAAAARQRHSVRRGADRDVCSDRAQSTAQATLITRRSVTKCLWGRRQSSRPRNRRRRNSSLEASRRKRSSCEEMAWFRPAQMPQLRSIPQVPGYPCRGSIGSFSGKALAKEKPRPPAAGFRTGRSVPQPGSSRLCGT